MHMPPVALAHGEASSWERLAAVASMAVAVAASLWWMTEPGGTTDVGVVPGTRPLSSSDAFPRLGLPQDEADRLIDQVVVVQGGLEQQRPPTKPAPTRLSIPALGVQARVVPIGVDGSGQAQVPGDVGSVGWYRFGPSPGSAGAAVLIGHVDSRVQGPGVFFELNALSPGDAVTVTMGTGRRLSFRVVARRSFRKELLPRAVFAREGPPVLVLVTCGGSFDERARRYSDNVVVYAVPRS
jgi:hypothetical protein